MMDMLSLDLVDKGLVTDQVVLTIGYDVESLKNLEIRKKYKGEIKSDRYGRNVPKHAHGTANLHRQTSSTRLMVDAAVELYERIVNPELLVRRVTIVANHVIYERDAVNETEYEQLDLFTDYAEKEKQKREEEERLAKEKALQKASIEIKKKYGKNAILKGTDFQKGAMTIERNNQIGGHRA